MAYLITRQAHTVALRLFNGMSSIVRSSLDEMSDARVHDTTRLALSDLDKHQLRDIGLMRTDVNTLDRSAKWAKLSPSRAKTTKQ